MHILNSSTPANRRGFVGGSDARIIMGHDEAALLRLWREKRGETEPDDLSGNLIVQPREALGHPLDGGHAGWHREGDRSRV